MISCYDGFCDLSAAGLAIWFWVDTWDEGHTDGMNDSDNGGDVVYESRDSANGQQLYVTVTLPSEGTCYIDAGMDETTGWTRLASDSIAIVVSSDNASSSGDDTTDDASADDSSNDSDSTDDSSTDDGDSTDDSSADDGDSADDSSADDSNSSDADDTSSDDSTKTGDVTPIAAVAVLLAGCGVIVLAAKRKMI